LPECFDDATTGTNVNRLGQKVPSEVRLSFVIGNTIGTVAAILAAIHIIRNRPWVQITTGAGYVFAVTGPLFAVLGLLVAHDEARREKGTLGYILGFLGGTTVGGFGAFTYYAIGSTCRDMFVWVQKHQLEYARSPFFTIAVAEIGVATLKRRSLELSFGEVVGVAKPAIDSA
jgi:drug/metabolite transporter (DMT)-like permease